MAYNWLAMVSSLTALIKSSKGVNKHLAKYGYVSELEVKKQL